RWGVGDALAGYAAGFVLQAFTLSAWVAATGHSKGLGVVAASLAGLWTGLAGAAVLASRRKGSGRLAADFGFRVEPRDVPVGVLAQRAGRLGPAIVAHVAFDAATVIVLAASH